MNLIKHNKDWLDPFDVMTDLQNDINRSFLGSLRRFKDGDLSFAFHPEVEVIEDDNQYVLKADLPGVQKEDVEMSIVSNVLTLKGEKKEEERKKEKHFFHTERRYGSFERVIEFPVDVQADKAKASFKDGVLEVVLPKAETAKPKQIKLQIG